MWPKRVCSLAELPTGTLGRVVKIFADGLWRQRLLDLGFTPGATVKVIRTSPTGDPVAYRLRGTTIALRKKDAALIWVEY
ncbi:MAG: FeoA family protein [Moorellaceae bacterium]